MPEQGDSLIGKLMERQQEVAKGIQLMEKVQDLTKQADDGIGKAESHLESLIKPAMALLDPKVRLLQKDGQFFVRISTPEKIDLAKTLGPSLPGSFSTSGKLAKQFVITGMQAALAEKFPNPVAGGRRETNDISLINLVITAKEIEKILKDPPLPGPLGR
jgi:hypothetical protein